MTTKEQVNRAKMAAAAKALKTRGVVCREYYSPDECHVDFIAVFDLGEMTKGEINEYIKACGLYCLFQV